jgi:hypothetical protein
MFDVCYVRRNTQGEIAFVSIIAIFNSRLKMFAFQIPYGLGKKTDPIRQK